MIGGCVNWALMVTMTMVVCKPAIRSTANAVQMFAGHVLGKSINVHSKCSYQIRNTSQAMIFISQRFLSDFHSDFLREKKSA